MFRNIVDNARGAAAIEYALLVSLLAIASMGSVDMVGSMLNAMVQSVASYLSHGPG